MGIEHAGHVAEPRHEAGIMGVVDELAGLERILEADDLEQAGQHDLPGSRGDPHGLLEEALMDVEPALGVAPKQIELARLVGRDGKRALDRGEKAGQPG